MSSLLASHVRRAHWLETWYPNSSPHGQEEQLFTPRQRFRENAEVT